VPDLADELHRGTVTFLFTDIEGSTALLKTLGSERYHDVLVEHQRLLRAAFAASGGREVDTQGDAFFVAFPNARDAVSAAVAAQRSLARQEWPDGVQVRVRIGIDTGEPVAGEGRYVGLGVHRTARIMAAAHGGQILVSRTTRDLIRDDLPAETSLRDLGEKRLKDLDNEVQLFQVVTPDLPSKFPRLRTAEPALGERLRRPYVAGPIVAVVAAAVVAAVLLTGGSAGVHVAPNSVGVIDPKTNEVVGDVPVGIGPGAVAVGGGSVWVGNEDDMSVTRIDTETRSVAHNIGLNAIPTGIATGERAVWVAEGALGSLVRISRVYNQPTTTFRGLAGLVRVSGGQSGSVTVGGGSVWAAYGSSDVARIDPRSNTVTAKGFAGSGASAVAFGSNLLWVANRTANTVSYLSPETSQKLADVNVGQAPSGVACGNQAVWVADTGDDAVSRIDPQNNDAVRTIPVGHGPVGIAYGQRAVWVANGGDGTVSRIDPSSGKVVRTIKVGGKPVGVAVGAGLVWVTVQAP
jgi:YVTN family beta-propeller protein